MMKPEEAIKILEVAKAECEWNAPLEYQEALEMAISALQAQDVPDINVGDTVSRQTVLDALDEIESEAANGEGFQYAKWRRYFCELPPEHKTDHGYMWLCPECGLVVHSDFIKCVRCGHER